MRAKESFYFLLLPFCFPAPSFCGIFPSNPFTDSAQGTTAASFLKVRPGARPLAMGEAYGAASMDPDAIFWNPAGLAAVGKARAREASLSFNQFLETSYLSSLSCAVPAGPGTLGLGVLYFSQSSLDSFDVLGDKIGSFKPYDLSISVAYARLAGSVSMGAGLKVIRSKIASESGTAWALDLGAVFHEATKLGDGPVDFGVGVRNLGAPMKMGGQSDPLPFECRVGMLWKPAPYARFFADGVLPVDQNPYAGVGLELFSYLGRSLKGALRAGYNGKNGRGIEGLAGMSAGAGISFRGVRLDYAWVPYGDLGWTNRVTLSVLF